MTIERTGSGAFEVACDSCPEVAEIDTGNDWQELMDMLREDGWTKRKVNDEWLHFCSECSGEED